MDTSPNKTVDETHSISLLDILGQVGFRGSSHVRLIFFLTFNYSLSPVREPLVCPFLYLSCARPSEEALLIPHLIYYRFMTDRSSS